MILNTVKIETTFKMEAMAIQLIEELDREPDSTILVPAPDPHHEGHMIRVRVCRGPYWLQWLREKESSRVRRYRLRNVLMKISSGIIRDTRYYDLAIEVITIINGGTDEEIYENFYRYF